MKQVVQMLSYEEFGLSCRSIYGLNIFEANSVPVDTAYDPRIIFLRNISEQMRCSALAGYLSLKDLVDNPVEMFGEPGKESPYQRVPIGLYAGRFYDIAIWPTQDACFFPEVTSKFWQAETQDKYSDIRKILQHDALALFVDQVNGNEIDLLKALSSPFPGEADSLQLILRYCSLVVISGGDAMDFHVYCKDQKNFEIVNDPLSKAVSSIENSEWYSENQHNLIWDSDEAICLVVPT